MEHAHFVQQSHLDDDDQFYTLLLLGGAGLTSVKNLDDELESGFHNFIL